MLSLSPASLNAQPDATLATAASRGDHRAFEFLVERYRQPLLGYCRRRLRNDARAEDVVQQTLISAWVGLSSGAEIDNVRAWLFRICHNATIDATRRRGSDWQEISASLPALGADDELGRRREARELLAAIADLPGRQREALLRTAIEGHSHEHVAAALGLSEGAVRGLVYRARATLRTAAIALTPPTLLNWLASSDRVRPSLAQRVAEILAGTGSAGVAGVLLKTGAVVVSAGALAAGAGLVHPGAATQASANVSGGSHAAGKVAPAPTIRGAVHSVGVSTRDMSQPVPAGGLVGAHAKDGASHRSHPPATPVPLPGAAPGVGSGEHADSGHPASDVTSTDAAGGSSTAPSDSGRGSASGDAPVASSPGSSGPGRDGGELGPSSPGAGGPDPGGPSSGGHDAGNSSGGGPGPTSPTSDGPGPSTSSGGQPGPTSSGGGGPDPGSSSGAGADPNRSGRAG